MKGCIFAPLVATLALAFAPMDANACWCGIARYLRCAPSCQVQCHTVMKTVRCVEYEQQQVTCYKTCWERVCEERVINCVKYVPETRTKEVCYTVCKPVWEERTHTYTVCKPVWETRTKEICYTVCKPVWEERSHTYTVCKPVWETRTKDVTYYVRKAVPYTKTIQVQSGHWETQEYEVPGPIVKKVVREPGCWVFDPCTCRCRYVPGKCHTVCHQCPPRKCVKKVWVPECIEKEISCTKYVCEPCVKQCTYKVCKMVPEQRTCTYKVCKMVPEQRTKTCTYKVCKMVPEERTCTYKVCKMVPEQRTKTCTYKVCKMVPEQRTCTYKVCKMVPEQRTRTVCYTVCKPVCYQKTIQCWKCVPKKVPYTVTRCVPRTVCKQVPVCVCCPSGCGCG